MAMREERGNVLVFTVLVLTVLLGGVGLAVDTSNLVLQRQQAQHGADAAALAIAQECVLQQTDCSPHTNETTARYFVQKNAPGADITQPVVPATGGRVTVKATETVPTMFMGMLGAESSSASATAVAEWGGNPVAGAPPLPLAVPYCQWLENKPGTSTTPILLRTDLVGKVADTLNTLPLINRTLSTLLPGLYNVTASCKAPDGQDIAQMRGPVWMTGVLEVLAGLIEFFPASCKMTTDDINVAVGGVLTSAVPPSCITKLGTSIKPGSIILLPIYVPANNLLQLGLTTKACGGFLGAVMCVSVPPQVGVKIIGYAPFKVSGWNFPGNVRNDPTAPLCSPLLTLLNTVAIGCTGITGRFVETVQKDPAFTYEVGGPDFGASSVQLVR